MKFPLQKRILETLSQWRQWKSDHSLNKAAAHQTYLKCCKRDGLGKPRSAAAYYTWYDPKRASPIEHDHLMAFIESNLPPDVDMAEFWSFCRKTKLFGTPLAALDCYPVVADDEGNVTLEPSRLQSCILHLLEKPDERAAADLIYLVEHSTPSEKWFGCEEARENYRKLAAEYKPKLNSAQADKERQQAIDSLKEIVNGWGDTFPDARMEIVLHDVRNPLHSIVAIRNTITGRLPGDPITDFGVVLIKAYSTGSEERFAGYESKLKGGHRVKSTTVPIFHRKDELIALLCINIDVSDIRAGMEKVPDESIRQFLGAFVAVSKDREITEHIQNAPRG